MHRKEIIQQKLSVLQPNFLEVIDQSPDHAGHAGVKPNTEGTHIKIIITADQLNNYSRIEQHRMINNLLHDEFDQGLHALSIVINKSN
ncbi:MAG: BolA family protein [Rickettsiaceae bacterium]